MKGAAIVLVVICGCSTAVDRGGQQPEPWAAECAEIVGSREFCKLELYEVTCRLQHAVASALCEVELPLGVELLVFIPHEDPSVVVVFAKFGTQHRQSWDVHTRVPNEQYPRAFRTLSPAEIAGVGKVAAAIVAQRVWEWGPE